MTNEISVDRADGNTRPALHAHTAHTAHASHTSHTTHAGGVSERRPHHLQAAGGRQSAGRTPRSVSRGPAAQTRPAVTSRREPTASGASPRWAD